MKTTNVLSGCVFLALLTTIRAQDFSNPTIPKEKCDCSSDQDTLKTKCFLKSRQSGESSVICTVEYDSMKGKDISSLDCKDENYISITLTTQYGGPHSNITVYCQASYRIKFDFDGILPHESLRIWHYRRITEDRLESSFRARITASPESTGLYTAASDETMTRRRDPNKIFFYISVHLEGKPGPLLKISKQILPAIFINSNTFALPCKASSPEWDIRLQKDGKNFTEYLYYLPTIGFYIENINRNFSSFLGLYNCFSEFKNPINGKILIEKFVNITIDDETLLAASRKQHRSYTTHLRVNASGNRVSCTSMHTKYTGFRFVNIRLTNPAEIPLRKGCSNKDSVCVGQQEANSGNVLEDFSESLIIGEGGGIFACFDSLASATHWREYVLGLNKQLYFDLNPKALPEDAMLTIGISGQKTNTLYTNITYNMSCTAVSYFIAQPLVMSVTSNNGTKLIFTSSTPSDQYENLKTKSSVLFTNEGVIFVTCEAFWWNSNTTLRTSLSLSVSESIQPKFNESTAKIVLAPGKTNKLYCDYEANPKPSVVWEKNGKQLDDFTRHLYIPDSAKNKSGVYSCRVTNVFGSAVKAFEVQVLGPDVSVNSWHIIGISGFVIGSCFVFSLVLLKHYRKSKVGLSKTEIQEFLNGEPVTTNFGQARDFTDIVSSVPYPEAYEVPDGDFSLDEENLLGSGAYGIVYAGKMKGADVAIKTLKRNAETSYLRSILSELRVMIYLEGHPNLVNLLGANTKHLRKGEVYLMVELCQLGSLENYLRKNRENFYDEFLNVDYSNVPNPHSGNVLTTSNLLQWCIHISSAMEYLFSKKVIHGDLAARNVLLQNNKIAKVSDFGCSRKIYEYSSYIKQSKGPLPWRHMALESLKDLKFSTESDVWAFGVTTWEIFSLGEVPYPGFSWNAEFVQMLDTGFRMKNAKFSNSHILDIQIQCWNSQEDLRPTFSEIREKIEALSNSLHGNRQSNG